MAGAGYKLFNSGDVLTAAQVNTYLMEQTVMVFDDAAARTTALSGVVSEGMISYLKDTNAVEVYNGSAWVASDDPNAIQNTIVDAKGDLITATAADTPARLASSGVNGDVLTVDTSTATGLKWAAAGASSPLTTKGDLYTYSTTNARLAVGSNGDTLVADSGATTGLRWQGDFAAGKNKIINGDFNINQRGLTSSTTEVHVGDRFIFEGTGGTVTRSLETFTLGAAPVAGYEGRNFARLAITGQSAAGDYVTLYQKIESVRTFAGQTATLSFWAKANSGTPSISVQLSQNFGQGGSPSAQVNVAATKVAITTSWARYSVTVSIPSISGKTVGTTNDGFLNVFFWLSAGSNWNSRTDTLGIQNNTFDIWGVQLEAGSVATAFQTATGTLAGELAACQRYYYKPDSTGSNQFWPGFNNSTTEAYAFIPTKVTMRGRPTVTVTNVASNLAVRVAGSSNITPSASSVIGNIPDGVWLSLTASGLTSGQGSAITNVASASAIEMSSEL